MERLREEASETENLKEKREKLEEAKRIQAEIDAVTVENAKEELRILQAQAELTPNATADNEALANAMVAVSNAEAQAASNMRRFNRELKAVPKWQKRVPFFPLNMCQKNDTMDILTSTILFARGDMKFIL